MARDPRASRPARAGRRAKPRKAAAAAAPASRSRLVSWLAGGVSLALIGTIAVIAAGYDARETPREEPSVWSVRSAGQYARVNTLTGEIDTVRKVEDPTGLVQSGAAGVVLSHGNGRAWTIDPTLPGNLVEESGEDAEGEEADAAEPAGDAEAQPAADVESGPMAMRTPDGTRDVIASTGGVVFRTEDGAVFFSAFGEGSVDGAPELGQPVQLDPLAEERAAAEEAGAEDEEGEEPKAYQADAASIDADGLIAMYSAAEGAVRWYDTERGEFVRGESAVPEDAPVENLQFATVAGEWAMLDTETGRLWREGSREPLDVALKGDTRLQASSTDRSGDAVLIADEGGLWSVTGDTAERVENADGVPAQPIALGDERYAAWIGAESGRLWSSSDEAIALDLDPDAKIPGDVEPVIRTSGTSALVTEVKTGMMWTVPDGKLIPVEQWTLVDPPKERDGTVVVNDVTEQEPPVAVADAFGVRAGEPAPLPVLLNDYDPNRKDVLTIVPEGVGEGLPEAFGTVSMITDGQSLVVQPKPDASGSATFSYRITDGVLLSEPASVTLTVVDPDVNTGPQWCPVQGCQREWPSPELAPGGTLVMPILEGWVDPEGDPMMLESAVPVNVEDPVRALVTADGRLALRHTDPNASDSDVVVRITVADSRGEKTDRELRVQVRSNAKAELAPIAATAQVNTPTTVRPLSRIVGGSGSYALVDASVQSGTAAAAVNAGAGTIEVNAKEPGVTVVAITARDTGTDSEITGNLRVTAVEARPKLGLPPLRAFVRPLADTTVDVLDAVPGANSRALVVRTADVIDGELRADVVEHAKVRVSGSTADGAPGRIGSADITVAEDADVSVGRLTVFQVPDTGSAGAIAVADAATVRAGAVADIPVLENDVAPPGQRLVLHPEVSGSGTQGELAFASGNTLRYLAPSEPGTYTLSYTTYSASSPEASDVGQVRVTVLPREGNRDPQPRTLTARLSPGERTSLSVPLSGVDPDGDRVRLTAVGASDDPQLSATLAPRSSAVQVEASKKAEPGLRMLNYTVRDQFGGEAQGRLRVIVTEADPTGGAPVTYSDYVRLAKGSSEPAVVQPLDNDIDPAGGTLEIVEVVPNVPGGADSPQYRELAERLDTSQMKRGRITVTGGDELGTTSYRYTARSSESTSTSDGLIVVQVSARVGQQAPTVIDTVLSARDRAELERGGVDVVTDRVYWAAGDVRSLKMSVWGSAADRFTAKGSNIVGKYRAEGDLVPFKLSGTDLTGAEVESFGFLVVPPLDELRLTLKPGFSPIRVEEGKSIDVALADVVDLGSGDQAEFKSGGFPTQRGQATCTAKGASTLSYAAGKEAPWTDTCVVSVKLTEQKAWTQLAVPIEIVPTEPVAELETLTRTVAPGASETINLLDMVRWQGGREGRQGDLVFSVSGGGGSFEVSPAGSQLTVQARADAVPGTQDALVVSVTGAGESQAPLTLRVGEAAKDTPRGATVQLSCTVGSTCQAQLIGAAGEYDPFQGKSGGGLELVGVNGGSCAVGTFQASGQGVTVGWPSGAKGPGGRCTATYTVKDAQNRVGEGTIELDAQGVPRPPAGIQPVSADASSVTLSVQLSGETAHPATTGVQLVAEGGSSVGSCSLGAGQATCTVSGLTPGQKRTYFARAVNSVGESDQSANGAETWAYRPPAPPSLDVATVKWPDNTNPDQGKVRVTIGSNPSGASILSIDGAETAISGDGTYVLAAGSARTVSVISADDPAMIPPGYVGGDGGRGDANTRKVTPIGAPRAGSATLELSGSNRTNWSITPVGWSENGGDELNYTYAIGHYSGRNSSGGGLSQHQVYTGTVQAANSYGVTGTVTTNAETSGTKLPTLTGSYTTNSSPTLSTNSILYAAGNISYSPWPTGEVSLGGTIGPGSPTTTVVQCASGGINCSDTGNVGPTGVEPLQMTLTSCVPWNGTDLPAHDAIASHVSLVGDPGGSYTFTAATNSDITVDWGGARGTGKFAGGLCAPSGGGPTPPETP